MRTTEQKRKKLRKLAKRRQAHCLQPHACLADFHGGIYECHHVSPWTKSACNVDAEVMILGKDWVSWDTLERELEQELYEKIQDRQKNGQDSSSRTNINLREFLGHMSLEFSETYATNVFPFIKRGKKSAPIPFRDLVSCAETYALPQIDIVSPRMAICLGQEAFNAVCHAAGLRPPNWRTKSPGPHICIGSVKIYGLPHPSRMNVRGGRDAVVRRWRLLGQHFQHMRDQDNHRS